MSDRQPDFDRLDEWTSCGLGQIDGVDDFADAEMIRRCGTIDSVKLHLIDTNASRRGRATFQLGRESIRTEPYADLEEFAAGAKVGDAILVHDEGEMISRVIDRMGESSVWLPLVAYAEKPTLPQVVQAISTGASDFISWPLSGDKIRQALSRLETADLSNSRSRMRRRYALSRLANLSERERQILALVAGGQSSRSIGKQLDISHRTVEIHRSNYVRKLGVFHNTEAVLIAFEAGLVEFEGSDKTC